MANRKVLLDNAYESWIMAIKYCNLLYDGLATLENKKNFVSALHNAVELFFKQIMLDKNEHKVAYIGSIKDVNDAQLVLKYMNSTDLNLFFKTLQPEDLKKFKSIEFSKLIEMHKRILNEYLIDSNNFDKQLKELQLFRNDETHFFIEDETFFNDNDFKELYNFMVEFYKVLHKYNLLPFWGEPCGEYHRLTFFHIPLDDFAYAKAFTSSRLTKKIISLLQNSYEYGSPSNSAYNIVENIIQNNQEEYINMFDELFATIQMMINLDMIKYEVVIEDIPEECGGGVNNYYIMCVSV